MNIAMLSKYMLGSSNGPTILAILYYNDLTSSDVIDANADNIIDLSEVNTSLTDAGHVHLDCIQVDIEDGVLQIGDSAFSGGFGVTTPLVLPTSLTEIGDSAFDDWVFVTGSLDLSGLTSLTDIGIHAFDNWISNTGGVTFAPTTLTEISPYCFNNWVLANMSGDLTLPSTVTVVGNYAFDDWDAMTNLIQFGPSLLTIGEYAFASWGVANKGASTPLSIPASVTTISNYAFPYWSAMQGGIDFGPQASSSLTSIGRDAFRSWLMSAQNSLLVLPDALISVGDGAFGHWEAMTSGIDFGSGLQTIEDDAFRDWGVANNGPTAKLYFPASLVSIGDSAFYHWDLYEGGIEFAGTNLTTIEANAFRTWGQATNDGDVLHIPSSVATLGNVAFYSWNKMLRYVVFDTPSSLTTIGAGTFAYWQLANEGYGTDLVIPDSVTYIGPTAFKNWDAFDGGLDLGTGVVTITDGAFNFWNSANMISNLVIPASVRTIGDEAFNNWIQFESGLSISEGVETIGDDAFRQWGAADMTSSNLVIPASVTYTGQYAFAYWSFMTNGVEFAAGSGLSAISAYCFRGWSTADMSSNLVIPSSIVSIESGAFYQWDSMTKGLDLTGATLLETIGYRAFYWWNNATMITDLVIPLTVTSIGGDTFNGWEKMVHGIILPDGLTTIPNGMCYGWHVAIPSNLNIPSSVTVIEDYAFYQWFEMAGTLTFNSTIPPTVGLFTFSNWQTGIGGIVVLVSVLSGTVPSTYSAYKDALEGDPTAIYASINGVPWVDIP